MGYPMTYQRVVARNALAKGDYDNPPEFEWHASGTAVAWDMIGDDPVRLREVGEGCVQRHNDAADRFNNRVRLLMGDLRRFEKDLTDEQAVCNHVARRSGIDVETVAAVLREFLSW